MTMFTPNTYASLKAMKDASILEAHSDTTYQNVDVFGYFEGNAYEAQYVYDEITEATWAIAGDCIDDVQIQEIEPKIVSMSIDHAATCYPDCFGGHQYSFCLYADGNTTYQDLKEGMLDWQNTDHLNYNLFKTDYEWGLYQDAVELLFHDAEEAGTMNDIFDPRLDIPVTEEEQEEYSCYAWFIIEPEFEDIEES